MKLGDTIRIVKVPPAVGNDAEFQTRTILEKCLGRTFLIMDVNDHGMVGINVGEVVGKASYMETIWIEPECVEVVSTS